MSKVNKQKVVIKLQSMDRDLLLWALVFSNWLRVGSLPLLCATHSYTYLFLLGSINTCFTYTLLSLFLQINFSLESISVFIFINLGCSLILLCKNEPFISSFLTSTPLSPLIPRVSFFKKQNFVFFLKKALIKLGNYIF